MDKEQMMRCSFCGKDQTEVQHLIAGPAPIFICGKCVDLCAAILTKARASDAMPSVSN